MLLMIIAQCFRAVTSFDPDQCATSQYVQLFKKRGMPTEQMLGSGVGGFLGMGTRMVVIRYDSLKFADNKIVLPGGTKDGLKMLPAFQYSKE